MRKFAITALLGLLLLCIQPAVWATIPGHIMLDYISDAFPLADGASIGFAYKTIAASTADTGDTYFYIEEPNRSSGIRVNWSSGYAQPARSRCVVVGGILGTENGERVLDVDYVLDLGNNPVLTPLGMDNPAIGGKDFNALTPGITDAQGPYNKGILIRAWGYVTESNSTDRYFYVDDGSGMNDGSGWTGVRVIARSGVTLPNAGDYVVVTGISSTYISGADNCRMVIARDPGDIIPVAGPTLVESKDAITPGANMISVPCVPWNDGAGSAGPNSVFSATAGWTNSPQKWNPANQSWRGITEGQNAVFEDEGYRFQCDRSDVLDPTNMSATVSYQAVQGILEQTDRYVPLYAGSNGATWIGYPFQTGIQASYTMVADGARVYAAAYATTLNWMSRYAERWDGLAQGAVGFDLASSNDVYRPWTAMRVQSKKPCALIIPAPSYSLQMLDRPDHVLAYCEPVSFQAQLKNANGTPVSGVVVTFSAPSGAFTSNGNAPTDTNGIATTSYMGSACGLVPVSATAVVGGKRYASQIIYITVDGLDLRLDLGKYAARANETIDVLGQLRHCDLQTPAPSNPIQLTTSAGLFANGLNNIVLSTDANGEVRTTLTVSSCNVTATVTATLVSCTYTTKDYKTVNITCDTGVYDNWPMFQHDAQHSALSSSWDASGPAMVLQWSMPAPTSQSSRSNTDAPTYHPTVGISSSSWVFGHPYIDSSPVVYGDKVVVGTFTGTYYSSTGSVRAFDADIAGENKQIWTTTAAMGGVSSTPAIYGNMVFVGSADGKLYCINLTNGAVIWSRQTTDRSFPEGNSRILSSPVVYGGVVYITNEASRIYAYSANTAGTLQPGYPISLPIDMHGITDVASQNECGASSPAIAVVGSYTYLLVGSDDAYLYRVRLSDRQVTSILLGSVVESSPSVSGNSVQIGTTYYLGDAFKRCSIEPLKILGTRNLREECRATPSISANGHLHVGVDTGHSLFKLDRALVGIGSGDYLARFDANTYFVCSAGHTKSAVSDNDWVFSGNDDGNLYGLRELDMTKQWQFKLSTGDTGGCSGGGFVATSPAISYNVNTDHDRWLFITSRASGGKIFAFKSQPGCNLTLTSPGAAEPCDNRVVITANYVQNGYPAAYQMVTFTTTNGTFEGSGTDTIQIETDDVGVARAYLQRPAVGNEADVSASAACTSNTVHIHFDSYTIKVAANPEVCEPNSPVNITATLTNFDSTPMAGKAVNLTTTNGVFANASTSYDGVTDANGQIQTTLTLSSAPSEATVTALHDLSCVDYTDTTKVKCILDVWPSFQGNLNNNGVTISTLGTNLVKKWRMPLEGDYNTEIWSSPVTDGSSVWVATNSANGDIYRFLSDGTPMNSEDLGSPVIGTPCLDLSTGTLYVTTKGGVLYSLNAANFSVNWSFPCDTATEEIWSSPKLYNGAVYFVSTDPTISRSYLYVIDASGGWELNTPTQMSSKVYYDTPAIYPDSPLGGRLYVGGMYHLAALDLSGNMIWQEYTESYYYSSPCLYDDKILIGNSHKAMGVEGYTDQGSYVTKDKDELSTSDPVLATVAAHNGKLYFGTNITISGFYACADLDQWAFDWMYNSGTMNTSTMISPSTNLAFTSTVSGTLLGFDMGTASVAWNYNVRTDLGDPNATVKSSFAAAGDRMYIVAGTAGARYLYCFGAP